MIKYHVQVHALRKLKLRIQHLQKRNQNLLDEQQRHQKHNKEKAGKSKFSFSAALASKLEVVAKESSERKKELQHEQSETSVYNSDNLSAKGPKDKHTPFGDSNVISSVANAGNGNLSSKAHFALTRHSLGACEEIDGMPVDDLKDHLAFLKKELAKNNIFLSMRSRTQSRAKEVSRVLIQSDISLIDHRFLYNCLLTFQTSFCFMNGGQRVVDFYHFVLSKVA